MWPAESWSNICASRSARSTSGDDHSVEILAGNDDHPVRIRDHPVPRSCGASPDLDRRADASRDDLLGAGQGHALRPYREAAGGNGGRVAYACIDDESNHAPGLSRDRQHLAPPTALRRAVDRDDQRDVTARLRHGEVHGEVVAHLDTRPGGPAPP